MFHEPIHNRRTHSATTKTPEHASRDGDDARVRPSAVQSDLCISNSDQSRRLLNDASLTGNQVFANQQSLSNSAVNYCLTHEIKLYEIESYCEPDTCAADPLEQSEADLEIPDAVAQVDIDEVKSTDKSIPLTEQTYESPHIDSTDDGNLESASQPASVSSQQTTTQSRPTVSTAPTQRRGQPQSRLPSVAASGGLGDRALDAWRSAATTAVAANPDAELPAGNESANPVTANAKATTAKREANRPDFEAEIQATRAPIPEQPQKDAVLDTSTAEAAVKRVQELTSKRLTAKSFSPIGTPPRYENLNPRDYVPATELQALQDVENALANPQLSATERVSLTERLNQARERIAAIEESGSKGEPTTSVPRIEDVGASSLTTPAPAQSDVMGDAIARAIASIAGRGERIATAAMQPLTGSREMPELRNLADTKVNPVETEMRAELEGIATAAGVTAETLKAKIATQKQSAEAQQRTNNDAVVTAATAGAEKISADGNAELASIAGVRVDADKEIQAAQDAVAGPPSTEAIEKKRDEMLDKVRSAGSEVLAAYRSALDRFNAKLDDGANRQKRDIQSASSNQRAAIRRHWNNDPDKGAVESLPTRNWEISRSTQVATELARFKRETKLQHDGFVTELNDELSTARDNVRDWAARQDGRERSWWEKLWDSILDWGTQAVANNQAWERQRNADSRDAMAGDLDTLASLRDLQLNGNALELNAQLTRLDVDQRALAIAYLRGNGVDSIGFVAESTMIRIMRRRTTEMTKTLQDEVIANWDWELLGRLARAKNPEFQPKVIANQVKGSIAGWGTKEDKLFAALGKAKGPIERTAVEKCYLATFGISMAEDVDDDVDGTEWRRAEALMKGDDVAIAVATIRDAVDGIGTDEQAIKYALRVKTPAELDEIKRLYFETHGVELAVDLSDDLSGEELDNALALANGDVETADAADLADAMSGPGTDEEKIQSVYDRIRSEVEAEARANGLSAAEMRAEIRRRNDAVSRAYEIKYHRSLQNDFQDDLGGSDLSLANALHSGDTTAIDAAKAKVEDDSVVYASDDRLEAIVRNQHKKAELEVTLDMGAERARLREQVNAGDITPDQYRSRMEELQRRNTPEYREQRIANQAQSNMGALQAEYGKITGRGSWAFDYMIRKNTMGYSTDEITALIQAGGKLSDADEIYFAIAGAGTDEEKIKEILKGKTPAQIAEIRAAYERTHGEGSFNDDILGDLSGREDLDTRLILEMGDPSTFPQQLASETDPVKRTELLAKMERYLVRRMEFEQTGSMGRLLSGPLDQMNTAEQMQDALDAARRYDAALANPDSDEAKAARESFDMQFAGAVEAQEQHREQIDSYAEIVVQIGAAAAGIAVTVATFGTAGPVVAMMYGAAAAAAAGMALKSDLRGAAYSWEEAGVDAAVGAVDVLAAGAGARFLGPALSRLEGVALRLAAKTGIESAAAKKIIELALKEAVQNGVEAIPSALTQAALDDKIWASNDPLGDFIKAGSTAAAMSAGISVSIAGLGGIARKVVSPKTHAEIDIHSRAEPSASPHEVSTPALPVPQPVDLPPTVDPKSPVEVHPNQPSSASAEPRAPSSAADTNTPRKRDQVEVGDASALDTKPPNLDDAHTRKIKPESEPDIEDWGAWLPSETVMQPGNSRSAADAQSMYDNSRLADPMREAAIYRNPTSGEFIVIQGEASTVHVGGEAPNANRAQAWKEILNQGSDTGNWELVAHSHPDVTPGNVAPANQWPSGANGDMGTMYIEAINSGNARSSRIDYNLDGKPHYTDFGVEPGHESPFWVSKPDGNGGRELHRFKSLEAYHEYMEMHFGADQGSVPLDFSTKQLDQLAGRSPTPISPTTPSAAKKTADNTKPAAPPAKPTQISSQGAGTQARHQLTEGQPALAKVFNHEPELRARFDAAVNVLDQAVGGMSAGDYDALAKLFGATTNGRRWGKGQLDQRIQLLEQLGSAATQQPRLLDGHGQVQRRKLLQNEGRQVLGAYDAGFTHEHQGRSVKRSPELEAEMNRLREVIEHPPSLTNDRVANALALERLRQEISRGSEILRSRGEGLFTAETTITPTQQHVSASDLTDRLRIATVDVHASGSPGQPLARSLPGMGLESYLLTPKQIGKLPTKPRSLAKQIAKLLAGYHRAHLVGPGFGDELFPGLMLAPGAFNLGPQNKGIEKIIRLMQESRRTPHLEIHGRGERLAIPLQDGSFEHVDILREVSYVIKEPGKPTKYVSFELAPPPRGDWRLKRSNIPGLEKHGIAPTLLEDE
ncbi:MAG: polymorphic toxin type 4 domain-containing protein [Pirellulaceae bacterium]